VERAKAQSEQDLKLLLANPTTLPISRGTHAVGNGASDVGASPDTASRDPVEDQVRATNPPKCTFAGVVEIAPKRFLDSGVSRVECPECARMRSLERRNDVLRFPSHDQRKTRTPQTERRWARRETSLWSGGKREQVRRVCHDTPPSPNTAKATSTMGVTFRPFGSISTECSQT
jgi:hypothetical protein